MKTFMRDEKGAVYISVIFISLTIFTLLISLIYISVSNSVKINSNNDSYRAGYIVESALELKVAEIMEQSDRIVNSYLFDLQTYKIGYIETVEDNLSVPYNPPCFSDYIKQEMVPDIKNLGETVNNPFEEYGEKHCYGIEIECVSGGEYINVISRGEYKTARKFINVELKLPEIVDSGTDEHNLPKISILPMKVVKYYQTFGL